MNYKILGKAILNVALWLTLAIVSALIFVGIGMFFAHNPVITLTTAFVAVMVFCVYCEYDKLNKKDWEH